MHSYQIEVPTILRRSIHHDWNPTDPDNAAASGIVERTLGREVVQPSTIAHYTWPESNPETVDQPCRLMDPADLDALRRAATPGTPDPTALRKNTRRMSLAETVLFILSRETFNFNGPAVNREPLWQQRVAAAVERGLPIQLVYPLVCKIGCWAKQMTNIGPNAAERACLYFFNHLNRVVKQFYAPGVIVELVCDAHLYNSAIQVPYHEVNAYVRQFTELAREVAPQTVRLHDYCDLLEQVDPGSRRYREAYQHYHRLLRERPDDALGAADRGSLFESVRALVNTRRLGLSYDDHRALFGPAPDPSNPHWAEIEAMTLGAVREMVATRMACSTLDVLSAAFPDMVRVSCHRGRKAGRAVVGLRVYPEYYRSSLFLPYHGIAVLWDDGTRARLEMHPEVVLRGDSSLVRVLRPNGDVFCYRAPTGWRAPAVSRGTGA
jgi:pyoverdine/dityrosine biosynthesis protein Dit1